MTGVRLFFVIIFLFIFQVGFSQIFENNATQSQIEALKNQAGTSYYNFLGHNTDIKIEVNLWGFVPKPGIYNIPYTTDLVTLLSIAGGPISSSRLDEIKIIRLEPDEQTGEKIITVNVEEFLREGDRTKIPVLKPGDTIFVAGSAMSVFSTIMSVIRDIALVLNTVFLIIQMNKR